MFHIYITDQDGFSISVFNKEGLVHLKAEISHRNNIEGEAEYILGANDVEDLIDALTIIKNRNKKA